MVEATNQNFGNLVNSPKRVKNIAGAVSQQQLENGIKVFLQ